MTKKTTETTKTIDQKVADAISKLEKTGKKPTAQAICQITGGSYRDLLPVIREVKAAREAKLRELEQIPALPEDVQDVFETVWATAWREADASAAEARKGFAARIEALEQEIVDLQGLAGEIEEGRDRAEVAATELQIELDMTQSSLQQVREYLKSAEARLAERNTIVEALLQRLQCEKTCDPCDAVVAA